MIVFFWLKCEHQTHVKSSIFQHQPYLNPAERYTIADRGGTVASYLKQNNLTPEQYEQEINNSNFYSNNKNQSDYKFIDPKNPKNPYVKNDGGKTSNKGTPRGQENTNKESKAKSQQNNSPSKNVQFQNFQANSPTNNNNSSNNNQNSSNNNKNQKVSTRAPPPNNVKTNEKGKKEGGCTIL
jgi:hypothetical protein